MELKYQISIDAEKDLKDIISYTNKKFGKKQVHKYTDELNLCVEFS